MKKIFKLAAAVATISVLAGCTNTSIEQLPSNNHNGRVGFLVIHHTAIDYQHSVRALTAPHAVSAHYLIPERFDDTWDEEELRVQQLVDESRRAWHAGSSHWQGVDNLNSQSIGIELVQQVRCRAEPPAKTDIAEPDEPESMAQDPAAYARKARASQLCRYPDYDRKQIDLLVELVKDILARHPDIGPTQVVGHADITPMRRTDPGPRFPWEALAKEGIGAWYDNDKVESYWEQLREVPVSVGVVQEALAAYGYGLELTGEIDPQTYATLRSFQMHFRPWDVSGEPDRKSLATLLALLEKYRPHKLQPLLDALHENFPEEDQGLANTQ
ncbi:N-acetylmuramoyl-L-alanine amidase [Biformimicrobium ophioploci]|uniref:N-acetylmuramoyl-L-alanine amidase n=1 Tax=Biformimicrobium ophioploci TaxID=3036711 RepID=A0ABQ6M0N4_9GAMM|nr:N-acetylmuramoyl-L-alanine amidase [Microbulbifer sp. NKW57]GMG87910.1 N-acetylmuramoyl-L-alanine amidase [Microbulbifer sp. NKW57]